jgi:ribosome biogenesis protein Nip4
MYLQPTDELRRIRITLVWMTVILLFTGGGSSVTVDHLDSTPSNSSVTTFQKNLVPLGNGYFGLFTGDREMESDNQMKVYYYDAKENKLVLMKDLNLDTVEMAE